LHNAKVRNSLNIAEFSNNTNNHFLITLLTIFNKSSINWLTNWYGWPNTLSMITFPSSPKKHTAIVSFGHTEIGPHYWVGDCKKNGIQYYAGQTFRTPASGFLKSIKLYSSIVNGSANATLSIYKFDDVSYEWKDKMAEASIFITEAMESQWIEFELPQFHVNKDGNYGFKLTCEEGMLAIAECPWNITNPYSEGVEWVASSRLREGNFHEDFDIAFEGEIEASLNAKFI
jgi:hypothetical protein